MEPSEGGDRGGLETRVASVSSARETRWRILRSTFVVGLAERTNKELRTAWEMYMRLFQTSLLLKNEESLDNKSIKGSKHLKIAMASLRRRC